MMTDFLNAVNNGGHVNVCPQIMELPNVTLTSSELGSDPTPSHQYQLSNLAIEFCVTFGLAICGSWFEHRNVRIRRLLFSDLLRTVISMFFKRATGGLWLASDPPQQLAGEIVATFVTLCGIIVFITFLSWNADLALGYVKHGLVL